MKTQKRIGVQSDERLKITSASFDMAAVVESVWTRRQNSGNKASKERWRTQRRLELMKESMGADRRGRIGMMCETPYLSIGDDYMDSSVRETQGSRVGAYTFRANSQHLDQTFTEQLELDDRTLPNCIGDPYVDDKRMRRGQRRRGRPRTAPAGRGGKGKKGDEAVAPPPPEEPADDDDAPAWRPNGGPQSNRPNPYLALIDQDTDEAVVRELVKVEEEDGDAEAKDGERGGGGAVEELSDQPCEEGNVRVPGRDAGGEDALQHLPVRERPRRRRDPRRDPQGHASAGRRRRRAAAVAAEPAREDDQVGRVL